MKRICILAVTVLLLLCTGCSGSKTVPEESVTRLWSQWDRENSAEIHIFMFDEEYGRRPCFSVENSEGQKLTTGRETASGTMPLLCYYLNDGSGDVFNSTFVIPYSEHYVIYFQQKELSGSLSGYGDTGDECQFISWTVTDGEQLEYQYNSLNAAGTNMTYDFTIYCNTGEKTESNFTLTGQSESQVIFKQQDGGFLVKSEDSPCTLTYGKLSDPLGESPAGQWSKISLVDDVWVMEPISDPVDE